MTKKSPEALPPIDVGKRLADIRVALKISRRDAAIRTGFTEKTIMRWETGQTVPDANAIVAVARAYGVKVGRILGESPVSVAA